MRISDWSSDVCSSDLEIVHHRRAEELEVLGRKHRPGTRRFGSGGFVLCHVRSPAGRAYANWFIVLWAPPAFHAASPANYSLDPKSVVSGKSVSVRLDPGGLRICSQSI